MTKKTQQATGAPGDAASAQRQMNELYTAHQVHTLAQLLLQQITANRPDPSTWAMSTGTPTAGGPGIRPDGVGAPGYFVQTGGAFPVAPQPILYWYP